MTDTQKNDIEKTINAFKLIAFPVLLAFMLWYLNKMDSRFDKWEDDIQEMKINQSVIQRDINELKIDTNRLRDDVDELKQNMKKQ